MSDAILRTERLNHWYGQVVALNDVTLEIGPGITGLLGPNGAGKTSLLRTAVGLMPPSSGTIRVLGENPWNNPAFNRRVGYCAEHDGFHEWLRGRAAVEWSLRLRGFDRVEASKLAADAIDRVNLGDVAGRALATYSRGMRQRLKIAMAIAQKSELVILDEPLTGTDPLVRQELIQLIRSFGAEKRHVIVSSHVLHEIELLTSNVVVMHRGRLVAFGNREEIRGLIDAHPHSVWMKTSRPRELASMLAKEESVVGVEIKAEGITARTNAPDAFYARLPALALESGGVEEIASPDDNLEAVFRYLTQK